MPEFIQKVTSDGCRPLDFLLENTDTGKAIEEKAKSFHLSGLKDALRDVGAPQGHFIRPFIG